MSSEARRMVGVGMVVVGFAVCLTVGLPGVLLMVYGTSWATDYRPAELRNRPRGR